MIMYVAKYVDSVERCKRKGIAKGRERVKDFIPVNDILPSSLLFALLYYYFILYFYFICVASCLSQGGPLPSLWILCCVLKERKGKKFRLCCAR